MYSLCIAFSILAPYFICSINPAIIAAKIKHGKDIREMGSGNPGLTNTLRTMGKGAAIVVLLCDVLKGIVSIVLVLFFTAFIASLNGAHYGLIFESHFERLFVWFGALSGVLGHCYPIYYKFKGGKAVLVTVATGLIINWLAALIALGVFILIVSGTKYVSLGSVIAAVSYPFCVAFFGHYTFGFWRYDESYNGVIFSAFIAAILVFKHEKNIRRLLNGTEKKLWQKEEHG